MFDQDVAKEQNVSLGILRSRHSDLQGYLSSQVEALLGAHKDALQDSAYNCGFVDGLRQCSQKLEPAKVSITVGNHN